MMHMLSVRALVRPLHYEEANASYDCIHSIRIVNNYKYFNTNEAEFKYNFNDHM